MKLPGTPIMMKAMQAATAKSSNSCGYWPNSSLGGPAPSGAQSDACSDELPQVLRLQLVPFSPEGHSVEDSSMISIKLGRFPGPSGADVFCFFVFFGGRRMRSWFFVCLFYWWLSSAPVNGSKRKNRSINRPIRRQHHARSTVDRLRNRFDVNPFTFISTVS